jgi:hypothetical protein
MRKLPAPALLGCMIYLLCSFDKPGKKQSNSIHPDSGKVYDVIIVPGVPFESTSLQTILKARMFWAKYLYDQGTAKNIIFSGSSVYSPFIEGEIMCTYADSMGIPTEHTFAETEAEHSTENIFYSVALAKKMGFTKIALATDRYQAVLLRSYLKTKYPEIDVLPIDFMKIDLNKELPIIDPETAYINTFASLVHRENIVKRFKGTMGKNIPYEDLALITYEPVAENSRQMGQVIQPTGASGSLLKNLFYSVVH